MNKIITWLEAHSKLGGGPSPTPTKCPTKSQLISNFSSINSALLAGYHTNQLVKEEDIASVPLSELIFEYPGKYDILIESGRYKILMCGGGGSGANDGSRSGHAGSGGNSGSVVVTQMTLPSATVVGIIVGKGGVMTDSNTDTNGVDGGATAIGLFDLDNTPVIGAPGGLGGCSYDGYSAAHAGNNIRVDEQIEQHDILISNPDPSVFSDFEFYPPCIGGHNIRYSSLCNNSQGFSGIGSFMFSSFGVTSKRYTPTFWVGSSGSGGIDTYNGGRPFQNPGVNGGGASNQGDSLAPVSASHGKWPGCGGGGRNFTAAHSGIGGNGVDGIVIITRIG